MFNTLAHLNELVAFEAVMRLGSVKSAAKEADITDGALSRKISQLEKAMGAQLFIREPRKLSPTPLARSIYADVQAGLTRLKAVDKHVVDADRSEGLTIAAPATFLSRWLIPRQESLQAALKDLPVLFSTYHGSPAMAPRPAHIFIAVGAKVATWQFDYTNFMPQTLVLVIQRDLYTSGYMKPDFASTLPRFVPTSFPDVWDRWHDMTGSKAPIFSGPMRHLERMHYAIEAVEAGQGCAIVPLEYVSQAVASGRLKVLHKSRQNGEHFQFYTPEHALAQRKTQIALHWLRKQGQSQLA